MGALSYRHFVTIPAHRARHGRESADEVADMALDFREVAGIVLWSGAPALLLALGGGWWLTRKSLAPVAALTRAAGRINERNLRDPLPRSGNGDELDRLTDVFNAMTARLDSSFQRVREFTLHASHELKTPLTVIRGELESALREERNGAPPPPARLFSQIDEIDRLTKIVDGLALLTKADAGQVALRRETVQLDELVRESFADANILAQPSAVRVSLSDCEAAAIQGDRHRLRQLLLNLTDNAVKYNQPGGTVAISLRRDGAAAELRIANTGAGLAAELQPRVFERFFRGDASHNRDVEGCGLGLSIAQWIVHAHDGTIQFASQPGRLTTVTVRLPLERAASP
jgi:signal transduction histidine kinase